MAVVSNLPAPYGPAGPRARTLGEWMLASPGTPARDGRNAVGPRKVLMVLVPRLTAAPAQAPPAPRGQEPTPEPVSGPAPSRAPERSAA